MIPANIYMTTPTVIASKIIDTAVINFFNDAWHFEHWGNEFSTPRFLPPPQIPGVAQGLNQLHCSFPPK